MSGKYLESWGREISGPGKDEVPLNAVATET